MCDRAYMLDGRNAGTRGELRAMLAVEPVYEFQLPDTRDDDCLCCCDVPATARAAGMTATKDDGWGDWCLTASEPNT